ncbi:D-lactonohydrolase-like protein [Artomyces pyxidatus]|uniref:D-lactonohydrolase-like protein n=1 Tax=Artomyces pyxidatus TaxID=48021 RepID=A0ACB8TEN1_9AGAM|nr:D-lactonohydrolase-like protein [Artomyces pyxidatus]
MGRNWIYLSIVVAAATAVGYGKLGSVVDASVPTLPPQAVVVNLPSTNVIGANGIFRDASYTTFFNPTNSSPPFFQVLDPAFLTILGPHAFVRGVVANPEFAFAHEAPIWDPETDEVFFASNDGGPLGRSDLNNNNIVSKIHLYDVAKAFTSSGSNVSSVNVTVTTLDLSDEIQMTNGGTGPLHGNLILITSGRGPRPPSIALVNPRSPNNVTLLLDNFYGRQFNSLNDIKVHPTSGKLFFTDAPYGFLNVFRPANLMQNQVYRFDPATGHVRVVADGFSRPNGLAFTGDGKTAFVTDTGIQGGFLGVNQTLPASIYQFDVDPKSQAFTNRRVFAFVDNGVPDGIQVDSKGNVYSGCGDGVHVWNSEGTLVGKIYLGTTSANLVFASNGRLVIMAETAIYLAQLAVEGLDLASFA